jgi:hypothetical protein
LGGVWGVFTSTWFFFKRVGGWVQVLFLLLLGYGGSLLGTFNPQQKKLQINLFTPPTFQKTIGGLAQNPHPRTHKCPPKNKKLKSGDETTF